MEDYQKEYQYQNKLKNIINEDNLLEFGFTKQFADRVDGFYNLKIDDDFSLTIGFIYMRPILHYRSYGVIKKLNHIRTIEEIKTFIFILTGKHYERQL